MVGAHYDTCFNPGADDNASSVAALLELARIFAKKETGRSIHFVAFVNEEPPFFGPFYPDRGNFIAVVGNLASAKLVKAIRTSFKEGTSFPVESSTTFNFVPGVTFSDHWSFWKHGLPAVMITDTAFYCRLSSPFWRGETSRRQQRLRDHIFTNCGLRCVFCINWQISQGGEGRETSIEELAQMMLRLQKMGCHNINLVTPTHYSAHILLALDIAARKGLILPVVYNTCGWERLEILKLLDGIVDIYLPDFKYWDGKMAQRHLSGVENYPEISRRITREEFVQAVSWAKAAGLTNLDIQGWE